MQAKSILKMTLHENYKGQVIWISTFLGFFLVIISYMIADTTMSHQGRVLDLTSYFIIDQIMLITAVLVGAYLYNKDFSNRGIAEIAIPAGISKIKLLFWRLLSHILCLSFLTTILLLLKHFVLSYTVMDMSEFNFALPPMLIFVCLKTALALIIAAFMGSITRPVLAILGTFFFFAIGHFATGVTGMQGIADMNNQPIPEYLKLIFKITKIWNPNYLVVESLQGSWEHISISELCLRVCWGLSAIIFFLSITMIVVNKKDIDAYINN